MNESTQQLHHHHHLLPLLRLKGGGNSTPGRKTTPKVGVGVQPMAGVSTTSSFVCYDGKNFTSFFVLLTGLRALVTAAAHVRAFSVRGNGMGWPALAAAEGFRVAGWPDPAVRASGRLTRRLVSLSRGPRRHRPVVAGPTGEADSPQQSLSC